MFDYLEVIKKYKLQPYLKYLLLHNKSNNAPYHNLYHTMCVLVSCERYAYIYLNDTTKIRPLLIAALFHDFNHSAGATNDTENVQRAISFMIAALLPEDKKYQKEIEEIILATEFPYTIPSENLTPSQKIIRDADLFQMMEHNFIQQIMIGLSTEMKKSLEDFLPIQKKFMENAKLILPLNQARFSGLLPEAYNSVKFIEEVLK